MLARVLAQARAPVQAQARELELELDRERMEQRGHKVPLSEHIHLLKGWCIRSEWGHRWEGITTSTRRRHHHHLQRSFPARPACSSS